MYPQNRLPSMTAALLSDGVTTVHPLVQTALRRCALSLSMHKGSGGISPGRPEHPCQQPLVCCLLHSRAAAVSPTDALIAEAAMDRNIRTPLLRQLVHMAGRTDPPAYIFFNGCDGAVTRTVDRFPNAKAGFTFACWCVVIRTALCRGGRHADLRSLAISTRTPQVQRVCVLARRHHLAAAQRYVRAASI